MHSSKHAIPGFSDEISIDQSEGKDGFSTNRKLNLYYSYSLADVRRMIDQSRLSHFGNSDPFYENNKKVILMDPCDQPKLASHLKDMLKKIISLDEYSDDQIDMIQEAESQSSKQRLQYLLIPIFKADQGQWLLLRVRLDNQSNNMDVLIHDPLGHHEWPDLAETLCETLTEFNLSYGYYPNVPSFEKVQCNRRYDTGPLTIDNIEKHLDSLSRDKEELEENYEKIFSMDIESRNKAEHVLKDLRRNQFELTDIAQNNNCLSAIYFEPTLLSEIDPKEVKNQFTQMLGLLLRNHDKITKADRFTTACFLLSRWLGCEPDDLIFEDEKGINRSPVSLRTLNNHLNINIQSPWKSLNAFRTILLIYIIALVDKIKDPDKGDRNREHNHQHINALLNECYVCLELLRVRMTRLSLKDHSSAFQKINKQIQNSVYSLKAGEKYLIHTGPSDHASFAVISMDSGQPVIDYIDKAEGNIRFKTKIEPDLDQALKILLKAKEDDEYAAHLQFYFERDLSNDTKHQKRMISKEQGNAETCICNNYLASVAERYSVDESTMLQSTLNKYSLEYLAYYDEKSLSLGLDFNGTRGLLEEHLSSLLLYPYTTDNKTSTHPLIGRTQLMISLSDCLKDQASSLKPLRLALNGLPGIGKTFFAEHLIKANSDKFTVVLKCCGKSEITFKRDLSQAFANMPGRPIKSTARMQWIKNWLANHQRWLIFIDDLVETELVNTYLPDSSGVVIVTSFTSVENFDNIKMDKMIAEDAAEFFHEKGLQSCRNIEETKVTEELIQILAGHPLSLRLAALYMQDENLDIENYCNILKQKTEQLRLMKFTHMDESYSALLPALILLFERIRNKYQESFKRLLQVSMCGGERLFLRYYSCFLNEREIAPLVSSGTIDNEASSLMMHQLIYLILRELLFQKKIGDLDLPGDHADLAKEVCQNILKHFQYRGNHTEEKITEDCMELESQTREFLHIAENWLKDEADFHKLKLNYVYYVIMRHYRDEDRDLLLTINPNYLLPREIIIHDRLLRKDIRPVTNTSLTPPSSLSDAEKLIYEVDPILKVQGHHAEKIKYCRDLSNRCLSKAQLYVSPTIQSRLYQKAGWAYESMYKLNKKTICFSNQALDYYKQALKLSMNPHYISLSISRVYMKRKEYDPALNSSKDCFNYFEQCNFMQAEYFAQVLDLRLNSLYNLKRYTQMQNLIAQYEHNNKLPESSKEVLIKHKNILNEQAAKKNSKTWASFYNTSNSQLARQSENSSNNASNSNEMVIERNNNSAKRKTSSKTCADTKKPDLNLAKKRKY